MVSPYAVQGEGGWFCTVMHTTSSPKILACFKHHKSLLHLLNNQTHSVPNGMKSQTWKFLRLLRKIQIHQQTKGLILIFHYQFSQFIVIKSEEITNISSKFNKNTVQSANPLDLILKIT